MTTKISFNQVDGAVVNIRDYLSSTELADIDSRGKAVNVLASVQAALDANPTRDIFFPSGTYTLTPTTTTDGLTVPRSSTTRILGEAGTVFYGDNTAGPLLTYRATADNLSLNRQANRGIDSITFESNWEYIPGTTNVNANTYDFTSGEGVCLAVGHDMVPITNCSFMNTPAGLLFESQNRVAGGGTANVYGGILENYRIRTCMYGIIFKADTSVGGQYVGGIDISKGFIGGVYKAAFASTGKFVETTIHMPVFENVTMLCAFMGSPADIEFGNGHYELGWSAASLTSQQIAETLDFTDIENDARYSAVRVHTSGTYNYYGYVDYSGTSRSGSMRWRYCNKPLYIDRGMVVVADVRDDANNFDTSSVVDSTYVDPSSYLHINTYESEKGSGVAVFKQLRAPFSIEDGQMFQVPHFVNKSNNWENLSGSPICFGGNNNGIDASSFEADGVLIPCSQEHTINASSNLQLKYASGYTASSSNQYVLYSVAIKVVSTSDANPATLAFDTSNKSGISADLEADGVWRTYATMVGGASANLFRILNNGANNVTLRITDMQAVAFDSLTELNDYVANRTFACGRGGLTAANDYIIEVNPTDNGVEITTEYEWSAATTTFNIYDNGHQGQNAGAYFEVEKMEAKLVSGTGVALNINDNTTSGYYVSSYTPSGTEWTDLTLANSRPAGTSFAQSTIQVVPVGTATMTVQLRTKLSFINR